MAIRKFRKKMKPFILVITAFFILSLTYGGYQSFKTSRANRRAQEAFKLNGKYVNKLDIAREENRLGETYKKNSNIDLDKELLDVLAFNNIIDKELTYELAKKLKIRVSSNEVEKEFENVEDSIGDEAQFKRMLEFQGFTKKSYKKKIKKELLFKKTVQSFIEDIKPTDQEIKDYYNINIQDKAVTLDSVKDKIVKAIQRKEGSKNYIEAIGKLKTEAKLKNVSEEYKNLVEKVAYEEDGFKITNLDLAKAELRQLLNLKTNKKISKEELEKRAKAILSKQIKIINKGKEEGIVVSQYLPFETQVFEYRDGLMKKFREQVKPTDSQLKQFFEVNKDRYRVKAYVDANLAFVNIKGSKEDEEIAKQKAEEVLKRVNKDNFDTLGKELIKDGYIYENLGTFSKGTMVKEFEEAVKKTPSGTIGTEVVKTGFGYHVIFVKENNSKQNKWTVSHILARTTPSQKTINQKLEKLRALVVDLEKGAIKFSEIQKLDEDIVQNREVLGITPEGNIPNIGFNKEITDKIFTTPLEKPEIIRRGLFFILFKKTKEIKAEEANFEKSKVRVKNDFINYRVLQKMMSMF